MKKVLAGLFAALLLLLSVMVAPISAYAQMSSVRNKRIVSVMYDDSGSMEGDKWVNANYAMQAFASMLNKEDSLYISYMSDYGNHTKSIDLSNPQAEIDSIRNHSESGETPVATLQQSFEALQYANDTNPNTQYWLVAFTDGDFNEEKTPQITDRLKKYAETEMPNGTKANIFFMTIGDTSNFFTPSDSNKNNIDVRRALKVSDVTDNIFSMAAEISGRYQVTGKSLSMPDSKTIIVTTDLPLFNIGVITQNTDVKVESIKSEKGDEVPIKSDVSIKAPESDIPGVAGASDEALKMKGHTAVAGQENEILPVGKYTISFSGELSEKDVAILLEPAIDIRIQLLKDGTPVDDNYQVIENEPGLSVKAGLYEYGTDNEILPSMLPDGVEFLTTHNIDDNEIAKNNALGLDTLNVAVGENIISSSAYLPGFFNLTATKTLTVSKPLITKIDAEVYPDGSKRQSSSDGPEVVYLTDLENNKTGIKFTVYEDGNAIDETRAKQLIDEFESGLHTDFNNYNIEILPDGSYLVYPTKKSFYYNPLIDYIFHHGSQKVSVEMGGISAEGALTFLLGNDIMAIIVPFLWIVLPLYFLWWLLLKKRFPKGEISVYDGFRDEDGSVRYTKRNDVYVNLSWIGATKHDNIFSLLFAFLLSFLPMSSKVRFCGYTFKGQKNIFHLCDEDVAVKNVKGKSVSPMSKDPTGKQMDSKTFLRYNHKLYIKESSNNYSKYICFELK